MPLVSLVRQNFFTLRNELAKIFEFDMEVIYIYGNVYRIESEIFSTYIVVLGILAITRKSKQIFLEHTSKK